MEPSIGSGVVITMPLITEDGRPVESSRSNNSPESLPQSEKSVGENGDAGGPTQTIKEQPLIGSEPVDKAVVQWKLSLHQIGRYVKSNWSCYVLGQVKILSGWELHAKESTGSDTRQS
jgi:hypothetical protein